MSEQFTYLLRRKTAARALWEAIGNAHPSDAAQLLAAALEELETDGPYASFADLRSDAKFWADCASPRELEVYLCAILRVLGCRAFGVTARKRLLVTLWSSLPGVDRAAFLARVDANNQFVGRAA